MFAGNKSLRKAGEIVEYDEQLLDEVVKCQTDILYFAQKYVYIIHPDRGKEKITLYEWQKKVLKACVETPDDKRHIIIKVPRQQGKCFFTDTKIKIRHKKTGEERYISIKDFLAIR